MSVKQMLVESYQATKNITGYDPSKPTGDIKRILSNDSNFKVYIDSLAESLPRDLQPGFKMLAENSRLTLLENSMYQMNPYETFALPVLRVFYPKFVAKEAITVKPIDKPEVILTFLRSSFQKYGSSTLYNAPSLNEDISGGPGIGHNVAVIVPVGSANFDLLSQIGLDKVKTHLQRDFTVTSVSSDGTAYVDVNIDTCVEGKFSFGVTVSGNDDIVTGSVDYFNGTLSIASSNNVVKYARITVTCALEENRINPVTKLFTDKIRLHAKDRRISTQWTINAQQDMKALFDMSFQAEAVNVIGQQIASDIDNEIIETLLASNATFNSASHTETFYKLPPSTFTYGPKEWLRTITVKLSRLSANIYNDTQIGEGNVILANPLDAAILEELHNYNYSGSSSMNGELGYRSMEVQGGKWRVFTSSIVPKNKMIITHKSPEESKCMFIYAPYVPALLTPYPLAENPSMTIISRYATALVRSEGIAVLNINEGQEP